jgi:hypothetical protein
MQPPANRDRPRLRAGMVGLGMIFDETYRPILDGPLFECPFCASGAFGLERHFSSPPLFLP